MVAVVGVTGTHLLYVVFIAQRTERRRRRAVELSLFRENHRLDVAYRRYVVMK